MTKKKPPLKRSPVKKDIDIDQLNNFAAGADPTNKSNQNAPKATQGVARRPTYPWEAPGVREDVKRGFNLMLSEPMLFKLRFLSKELKRSQQKILRDAIRPAIEKQLKKLLK